MLRFWKQGIALVALAVAVGLWCLSPSLAAKPIGGPTPAQLNPAIAFIAAQKTGRQDVVVAAADLGSEILLTGSLQPSAKGCGGCSAARPGRRIARGGLLGTGRDQRHLQSDEAVRGQRRRAAARA